jgi:hypothetical protein
MTKFFIAIVLISIALFTLLKCESNTRLVVHRNLEQDATYNIILMAGQSNMAGAGDLRALPDSLRHIPENFTFIDLRSRSFLSRLRASTFGPEVGLSHLIGAANPHMNFALIKFAVHASSLYDWSPYYSKQQAKITGREHLGSLYDEFIMRLKHELNGKRYHLIALLWMQGERDAHFPSAAGKYEMNMKELLDAVRMDLKCPNLPLVMGLVNPPETGFPAVDVVRHAQQGLSETSPLITLVDTDDLSKHADQVHYDAAGQLELGRRFGKALSEYIIDVDGLDKSIGHEGN